MTQATQPAVLLSQRERKHMSSSFEVAAPTALDLAAWGCIEDFEVLPEAVEELPRSSAAPTAPPPRMSPVCLPTAVVRPQAKNVQQLAFEWRSALACLVSVTLLLYTYGVQPGVLLPLLCLAFSVLICSQQAAASAAAAAKEPSSPSAVPWYDGGSSFLAAAKLKRFGRAAFYIGKPGAPPCSPHALPIRHSPDGSPKGSSTAAPTPGSPAGDRRGGLGPV